MFCVCCCLSDFFSVVDFCVRLKRVASMNLSKVSIPLLIKEILCWRSWEIDTELFGKFTTGVLSIGEEIVSRSLFEI